MKTQVYKDFDAFCEGVRDVNCTMMLQNPKRRVWSVTHIDLPGGVHIQMGQLGSGNLLEGQSIPQGYLFYMPLSKGCEYLGNGVSFGRGQLWKMEPGAAFHLATRDQHDWCTVFIPSEKLARADGVNGPSTSTEKPTCRVLTPNRHIVNGIEALVRDAMVTATKCESFETSFAAKRAAVAATILARSLFGGPPESETPQRGRPRGSRRKIIRSCWAQLEERRGQRILVSDLATAAGVSERSIRTVFNETFGVTPTRYLQLKRLHEVHRTLRAADADETSVSHVLAQHNEWQLGRFAAQYRRLFGEKPSETLANKFP